jgi:hypothetical protein
MLTTHANVEVIKNFLKICGKSVILSVLLISFPYLFQLFTSQPKQDILLAVFTSQKFAKNASPTCKF